MSSWLSKARKLKGITAKQLAKNVGVSLNYIQQIEGGRPMSDSLASRIYDYLGFDEGDIPFESNRVLEKLRVIEEECENGENQFCLCTLHRVGYVSYIVDCSPAEEGDLKNPPDNCEPIRIRYAKNNLEAQMALFDGCAEEQLEEMGVAFSFT